MKKLVLSMAVAVAAMVSIQAKAALSFSATFTPNTQTSNIKSLTAHYGPGNYYTIYLWQDGESLSSSALPFINANYLVGQLYNQTATILGTVTIYSSTDSGVHWNYYSSGSIWATLADLYAHEYDFLFNDAVGTWGVTVN